MVQEKLIIERFGGIDHFEIAFGRINLFIGPQAAGKSLVVKLAYYFKHFFSELHLAITDDDTLQEIKKRFKQQFLKYFPQAEWGQEAFIIRYQISGEEIEVTRKQANGVSFTFSKNLDKFLKQAIKLYEEADLRDSNGDRILAKDRRQLAFVWGRIASLMKKDISPIAAFDQCMVTAGRSYFAAVQMRAFSWLAEDVEFDPMLIEFGALLERYKFLYLKAIAEGKLPAGFDDLGLEILKGKYAKDKDREFFVHADDRKVSVANASSGQQAALPIVMLASAIAIGGEESGDGVSLYIEEPEAHIFPDSQKRVVQLLARTFNHRTHGCQLFITTHSPFILTAFNNLLEAGSAVEQHPERADEIMRIVPKEELLHIRDVAAYTLDRGKAIDMIDKENGLILARVIDAVTEGIAIEFDQILDLKYD